MDLVLYKLGNRYILLRLERCSNGVYWYTGWEEWRVPRNVTVKVFRLDLFSPDTWKRFLCRCEDAGSLIHPNIARLYENGAQEDIIIDPTTRNECKIAYIVMEHVGGGDLSSQLVPGQAYPLGKTVRILEQLCAAVEHAHSRGMIHGHIGPSNIFFRGNGDEVVVSDFERGFSVNDTHVLFLEAQVSAYMAPELRKPEPVNDVYSLGVVLYQLCTGNLPSLWRTPIKPTLLNPNLPPALDDVILRALRRDPSERFASASLFKRAIQSAAGQTLLLQSDKDSLKVGHPRMRLDSGESSSVKLPETLHGTSVTPPALPMRIVKSYDRSSDEDSDFVEELEIHLRSLTVIDPSISSWDASMISAGSSSLEVIDKHLSDANVILLIVSSDYLISDYCCKEMKKAMKRHESGEARVVPIIFRSCNWGEWPFAQLEVLPKRRRPIDCLPNRDKVLQDVIGEVKRVIEEYRSIYP
jgi:serine/threonine protein kinase